MTNPHSGEFGGRIEFEEEPERVLGLLRTQVAQLHLEHEPSQARRESKGLAEVRGAGEREPDELSIHVSISFTWLTSQLRTAPRRSPQQRVGLVKDKKGVVVQSLLKGAGDALF